MASRKYGEGSIFKDPEGPGYIAAIELPPTGDGRRRRVRRKRPTKSEADAVLVELQDEFKSTGRIADPKRRVIDAIGTFDEARARKGLSEGTREEDSYFADIIAEQLGGTPLVKLTVHDCDRFLRSISKNGPGRRNIGSSQLSKIRRRLINVLRNEIRIGNLSSNVAELSDLPTGSPNHDFHENENRRALSHKDLQKLIERAEGSREILIDLCGRNALRPAEARSLRWIDLDLAAGELSVRGQQSRSNKRTRVKRAHNAARTIQIRPSTVNRLSAWKIDQETLKEQAGLLWSPAGFVATTATGNPIDRRSFAASVERLCNRVELTEPITPYELRHTAISHQADAGWTAWEIADWAGTSEDMISRVYRHRLRRVATLRPDEGPSNGPEGD